MADAVNLIYFSKECISLRPLFAALGGLKLLCTAYFIILFRIATISFADFSNNDILRALPCVVNAEDGVWNG
jgi:hypothetical protein